MFPILCGTAERKTSYIQSLKTSNRSSSELQEKNENNVIYEKSIHSLRYSMYNSFKCPNFFAPTNLRASLTIPQDRPERLVLKFRFQTREFDRHQFIRCNALLELRLVPSKPLLHFVPQTTDASAIVPLCKSIHVTEFVSFHTNGMLWSLKTFQLT